jgi:hypothetical protein
VNLTDQLNEMREELEEKIDEQVTWEFCCFRVWSFSDWNTNVEKYMCRWLGFIVTWSEKMRSLDKKHQFPSIAPFSWLMSWFSTLW